MLKTIPVENYEDSLLLEINPKEDIETLRKIYNPQVDSDGVYIFSGFGIEHLIDENVSFISDPVFLRKNGETKKVVDSEILDLNIYDTYDEVLYGYGVCDNAQQVIDKFELNSLEKQYTVILTPIFKEKEPPADGWRWNKWGEYIGIQKPTAEYIYDESEIDMVFVYSVYQWEDKSE